jgi:phosphoglycerate dehydrogenase-like enzyme
MVKIFLADPAIRAEQLDTLRKTMPEDWAVVNEPQQTQAFLTENVEISAEMLAAAGADLRLILRLVPGSAPVAKTDVPVVDLASTGMVGVAEHVVELILALSRRLLWVAHQTAQRAYVPGKDQPILTDQRKYTFNWIGLPDSGALYRKKMGIVGLGYIGREVAKRLRSFGMQLFYYDVQRMPEELEREYDIQWRPMDDLLKECDFITLHLRFVDSPDGNDKMFGAREFGLMKPTAYFINTSRGRVVDEDALVEALRAHRIAGAGLDVFRYEPLPVDHPLFDLVGDNVILTPHVAGTYMVEAWQTTANEIIERIQTVL